MTTDPAAAPSGTRRTRDAVRTRQSLLDAARRRFARDGYSVTTSRDIAADAGVNVALINRYFSSKEGLFEACLARTVDEIDAPSEPRGADDVSRALIDNVIRISGGEKPLQMLLLLRSSGDEAADAIRRRTLRSYAEQMAATIGWRPDDPATAPVLLRAEVAMALGLGVAVMRNSGDLSPLATATVEELEAPLRSAVDALLATDSDVDPRIAESPQVHQQPTASRRDPGPTDRARSTGTN